MEHTLDVDNKKLIELLPKLAEFQLTHNELKNDVAYIFELADQRCITEPENCQSFIRVCYKEVFSLIEADIYLINQFNPFPEYRDSSDLETKIKKTFKHHALTFGKEDDNKAYSDSWYRLLFEHKKIRDEVTHPKGRESINIDANKLVVIRKIFDDYHTFISTMMVNVFIKSTVSWEDFTTGKFSFAEV